MSQDYELSPRYFRLFTRASAKAARAKREFAVSLRLATPISATEQTINDEDDTSFAEDKETFGNEALLHARQLQRMHHVLESQANEKEKLLEALRVEKEALRKEREENQKLQGEIVGLRQRKGRGDAFLNEEN